MRPDLLLSDEAQTVASARTVDAVVATIRIGFDVFKSGVLTTGAAIEHAISERLVHITLLGSALNAGLFWGDDFGIVIE